MHGYLLKSLIVLICLVVPVLHGCSSVAVDINQHLGIPDYAATDPAKIEILQTMPETPIEKIGEIVIRPYGNPTKQDMETKLKYAAAGLGADAVVIISDKTEVVGGSFIGPRWNRELVPEYARIITASAIRYKR